MYEFPSFMPYPLQSGYSREEGAGFIASAPASGAYYAQIITDDEPTYFTLSYACSASMAAGFRAWLRADNKAVLRGAQFTIPLLIESEIVTQTASFSPDGIPQLSGFDGVNYTYTMRIVVPRMVEPMAGSEELVFGVAELGGMEQLDFVVNTELPGAE